MVGDVKILVPVSKLYEVAVSSRHRDSFYIRLGTGPCIFTRNLESIVTGVHPVIYKFVSHVPIAAFRLMTLLLILYSISSARALMSWFSFAYTLMFTPP